MQTGVPRVAFNSDAAKGRTAHLEVTLGAANALTTIALPEWARGFRIHPNNGTCRFAVDEDPAAEVAASAATDVPVSAWGVGGNAMAGQWETRLLTGQNGVVARTLRLRSATAANVIRLGLF